MSKNRPVAGASYPSTVVRDGIVVDYMGAVRAVTHLKGQLEERLGVMLDAGACAIPPGILEGNVKGHRKRRGGGGLPPDQHRG